MISLRVGVIFCLLDVVSTSLNCCWDAITYLRLIEWLVLRCIGTDDCVDNLRVVWIATERSQLMNMLGEICGVTFFLAKVIVRMGLWLCWVACQALLSGHGCVTVARGPCAKAHPGSLRPYQSKMFDWYGFYHISQLFFAYQSTFFHISQTFFHISQRYLSYQSEFRLAYQSKFRADISQSTFDCKD